jgi:bifunctional non-homologous end joining protein LigD
VIPKRCRIVVEAERSVAESSLLGMARSTSSTLAPSRAGTSRSRAVRSGGAAATITGPPPFRPVQLAKLVDAVPGGDRWLHEMKYDGYRTLLAVGGGEARAYTRSGLDWSDRFTGILNEASKLKVRSALIDGEAVVLDTNGRTSFQALQGALKGAPDQIDYFAFDLLELGGEDLTGLPLIERKKKLALILPKKSDRLRYSDHIVGIGEKLFNQFCAAGLEGVISKLATGKYVGSRSGGWLKTKCIKRQEFVVVGWTPSDKSRSFRSLILGVHDGGELRYAGKVGTGFDTKELFRLMEIMKPLEQKAPTVKAPRAEVRGAHAVARDRPDIHGPTGRPGVRRRPLLRGSARTPAVR